MDGVGDLRFFRVLSPVYFAVMINLKPTALTSTMPHRWLHYDKDYSVKEKIWKLDSSYVHLVRYANISAYVYLYYLSIPTVNWEYFRYENKAINCPEADGHRKFYIIMILQCVNLCDVSIRGKY